MFVFSSSDSRAESIAELQLDSIDTPPIRLNVPTQPATMADTQHFCLRWNNYQSSITSAFENLRDDEDFVDVTLACDGRSLKAHRVVLSACSPYFRELLKVIIAAPWAINHIWAARLVEREGEGVAALNATSSQQTKNCRIEISLLCLCTATENNYAERIQIIMLHLRPAETQPLRRKTSTATANWADNVCVCVCVIRMIYGFMT